MRIAVLAAMPREYRPFLTLLGSPQRLTPRRPRLGSYPAWSGKTLDREILVLETGIGRRHAAEAARCLVARYPLDLVLSVGFAGGLSPDLPIGQLVWSRELTTFDEARECIRLEYRSASAPALEDSLAGLGAQPAWFVTVEQLQPKAPLAAMVSRTAAAGTAADTAAESVADAAADTVADAAAVVEMESAAVAAVAYRHEIPFLGLRAISDALSEEIDLDLDRLLNRRGRVSVPRAALAALRRPSLVPSFQRWTGNSRIAGVTLAHAVEALLRLPEQQLRSPALVREPDCGFTR
jgi:adenosylhomocysteine nucleosidase